MQAVCHYVKNQARMRIILDLSLQKASESLVSIM